MTGFIFILVFTALVVQVDDTTMQSHDRELRHKSNIKLKQSRKGMYRVKRGHWCQLCLAGKYLVKHCENNRGLSICKPCPVNSFIDKPNNQNSCNYCTICGMQQHLVKDCTRTSDRQCRCPSGKFWHVYLGHTGICLTHKVCPGITLAKGTPFSDTVCGDSTSSSKQQPATPSHGTTLSSETTPTSESTFSTSNSLLLTTTRSINYEPCESQHQCCDKWFVIAVVALVLLGIALLVIVVEVVFVIKYFRQHFRVM